MYYIKGIRFRKKNAPKLMCNSSKLSNFRFIYKVFKNWQQKRVQIRGALKLKTTFNISMHASL